MERKTIHEEIGAITRQFTSSELVNQLGPKGLVAAPIHTIPQVLDYPPIRDRLLTSVSPGGDEVRLPPPSVEREHLASTGRRLAYAPAYGQDTGRVLASAGFSKEEIAGLMKGGIVA
jgi:crotonobetainyl-CoA:carnitine CoA-transferase CaiB-like acyl-CoA transferase